jgi:bla regulator protein BlaR1
MIDIDLFSFGTTFGSGIANHLWQSTLFLAVCWLLTIILRKNRARIRYWIWVAASIKFLIPFSLLVSLGSSFNLDWNSAPQTTSPKWNVVQNINQPFRPSEIKEASPVVTNTEPSPSDKTQVIVFALWLCGSLAVLLLWLRRGKRISMSMRNAERLTEGRAVEALFRLKQMEKIPNSLRLVSSETSMEPGVFGIIRPVLQLPAGMPERLEDSELEAILSHELSHVRCHDNLIAALHMLVQALFWFHPAVWWIGSRLIHERELACDEAVLQSGNNPQAYAKGILKVCELYFESPLACISGVIGSNLKKRIEGIMKKHIGHRLNVAQKLLLMGTGFVVLALPLVLGIVNAPPSRAQSLDGPKPLFETVSIKPSNFDSGSRIAPEALSPSYQPGGRFVYSHASLTRLICYAYDIHRNKLSGIPSWSNNSNFSIEAEAGYDAGEDEMRLMLQSMLEDKFGLIIRREIREAPFYSLEVAEGGHKLQPAIDENGNHLLELPSSEDLKAKIGLINGNHLLELPSSENLKAKIGLVNEISERFPNFPNLPNPNNNPLFHPGIGGGGGLVGVTGEPVPMTRSREPMVEVVGGRQDILGNSVSIKEVVDFVYSVENLRLVDRTGLSGLYNFYVEYYSKNLPLGSAMSNIEVSDAELPGPTIFEAFEQHLGLKPHRYIGQDEFFVIDSVQKPIMD